MFKITGGTFTVNATDASSSITFDGNKDNVATSNSQGGAFYVLGDSTKFTLNGAEKSGGGKTITIQNNAVTTQGGGVYIGGSGTNTLESCSITKNTASSSYSSASAYGGGVCIYGGTNTLSNCSITGNTVSASNFVDGGGVFIYGGTNTLLGTMNITGNTNPASSITSDNLYLEGGYTVALSDSSGNTLSTRSKIGVKTSSMPGKFATGATSAMARCFTPYNSIFKVTYSDSDAALSLV